MSPSPYRAPPPSTPPLGAPCAELVYPGVDRARVPRTIALVTMAATATTGWLGAAVSPAGGVVLGATLAWSVWRWRPAAAPVRLHVCRGVLRVTTRPDRVLLCTSLRDVANVTLDSRTIRKLEEGSSLFPWARFSDSRVGPELDVVRIEVEVVGQPRSVRLSETYVPHMLGVDWLGRIRRFLRSHGWVPEDERDGDAPP